MRFQYFLALFARTAWLILLLAGCLAQGQITNTIPGANPVSTQSKGNSEMIQKNRTLNIAHRGARSIAPENTLLAAQKALGFGADLWELDVAMTKDSQLVVIHDDTLERTSDAARIFPDRKPWAVTEFTLDEIRKLDFGSWYAVSDPFKQISGGQVLNEDKLQFLGLKIPTLLEALTLTKDNKWKVNIEIKDHAGKTADATIVEKVVGMVVELAMQDSVIISSFNHEYLVRVKKANAAIKTAVLTNAAVADPLALVVKFNADAYNPNYKYINAQQVASLIAAGKGVNVWTVNDEVMMRNLIGMGVSGIITDYPQLLKQVLAGNMK